MPPVTRSTKRKAEEAALTAKDDVGNRKRLRTTKNATTVTTPQQVEVKAKEPRVDEHCSQKTKTTKVYVEKGEVFSVTLVSVDVKYNVNRFYHLQLLQDGGKYAVWSRNGRIGCNGEDHSTYRSWNRALIKAKQQFSSEFRMITGYTWPAGKTTLPKFGLGFGIVDFDYTAEKSEITSLERTLNHELDKIIRKEIDKSANTCQLDSRVQELVNLFCGLLGGKDEILALSARKKLPLGKPTLTQIEAGFEALKTVFQCLSKKVDTTKATQDYYSKIPHNFGKNRLAPIKSLWHLKLEVKLLEAMYGKKYDLGVKFTRAIDGTKAAKQLSSSELIDQHYSSLGCDIRAMDSSEKMFKLINTYLKRGYYKFEYTNKKCPMSVVDVFEIKKHSDKKASSFKDFGNKMLLWHGSRVDNWRSILTKGLVIPKFKYSMSAFGSGIYFADVAGKSAQYVDNVENKQFLLLCEVSLGTTLDTVHAPSKKMVKSGTHSVKALGRSVPKSNKVVDDVTIPLGPQKNEDISNPKGYTFRYNEYVIYNPKQAKMRYLVKFKYS